MEYLMIHGNDRLYVKSERFNSDPGKTKRATNYSLPELTPFYYTKSTINHAGCGQETNFRFVQVVSHSGAHEKKIRLILQHNYYWRNHNSTSLVFLYVVVHQR